MGIGSHHFSTKALCLEYYLQIEIQGDQKENVTVINSTQIIVNRTHKLADMENEGQS